MELGKYTTKLENITTMEQLDEVVDMFVDLQDDLISDGYLTKGLLPTGKKCTLLELCR